MKVYCPTCGNDHNEQLVTCSLCGSEFDVVQTKLAVKNQIMKRAIKLWQVADQPAVMEGHFLDQAEEDLRLEMEAKTIKFICKMAEDASQLIKRAAMFCKSSTNEAETYDWNFNANDLMSQALGLVHLVKNKVAPQSNANTRVRTAGASIKLVAKDMPPYPDRNAYLSTSLSKQAQAEDRAQAQRDYAAAPQTQVSPEPASMSHYIAGSSSKGFIRTTAPVEYVPLPDTMSQRKEEEKEKAMTIRLEKELAAKKAEQESMERDDAYMESRVAHDETAKWQPKRGERLSLDDVWGEMIVDDGSRLDGTV